MEAALEAELREAVEGGISPGLSVGVGVRGQPVSLKARGCDGRTPGGPLTPAHTFMIGSITKQFTAALTLALHEQGRLRLDARVADHLPGWPERRIRVKHLLGQTSGLSEYTRSCPPLLDSQDWSEENLLRTIVHQSPLTVHAPGELWMYGNSGYSVLGCLCAQVSGVPLAEALRTKAFDPLGLRATHLGETFASAAPRAAGLTRSAGGGYAPAAVVPAGFAGGAGGLRSNAEDLLRWAGAFFDGRLVGARLVDLMTRPVRLKGGRQAFEVTPAGAVPVSYGMGLDLGRADGRRYVEHTGSISGFAGLMRHYVDAQVTVAALANADVRASPHLPELLKRLMALPIVHGVC